MLVVGVLFGALWLMALVQGRAMDEHTRRVDAQWHESHEQSDQSESEHSTQSEPSEPATQDG